jgi:AAA+ ATPase superfamily predicted ATPase
MMKFVDRVEELSFLERKRDSPDAEMIIIYGRRRVGKTSILNRFLEGKPGMYFLGRLEPKEDSLKRLNNLFIEFFGDTALLNRPLRNWDDVFDYLADRSEKERVVLVLDEFPYIVERSPQILSVLQDKWDNRLKGTHAMLVLSGSSVSMMEQYALDQKSPIYGRRSGQWRINKLDPSYLSEFFPSYSLEEQISVYACLDTIPGYLVKFSSGKSVKENLIDSILSKGEFLYEEVGILLREEFRDPSNYSSIISTIAGGTTSHNEIYTRTGMDKSMLSKYLYVLENLGIIEKILPVTHAKKARLKTRGGMYRLKDNFFDYWFTFVYPNASRLELGETQEVYAASRGEYEKYLGYKFERYITEILPRITAKYAQAGTWWHKEQEIDLVALNEQTKDILFAECKWKKDVAPEKIFSELIGKAESVEWNNSQRKEEYALFAKSYSRKITEYEGKKVACYDLSDLEDILKRKRNRPR